MAKATFGARNLRQASPIARASKIHARVLAATAADDILIPRRQDTELVKAIRKGKPADYAVSYSVARGSELFVHGTASKKALAGFDRRVAALVGPFGLAPIGGRVPSPIFPGLDFAFRP